MDKSKSIKGIINARDRMKNGEIIKIKTPKRDFYMKKLMEENLKIKKDKDKDKENKSNVKKISIIDDDSFFDDIDINNLPETTNVDKKQTENINNINNVKNTTNIDNKTFLSDSIVFSKKIIDLNDKLCDNKSKISKILTIDDDEFFDDIDMENLPEITSADINQTNNCIDIKNTANIDNETFLSSLTVFSKKIIELNDKICNNKNDISSDDEYNKIFNSNKKSFSDIAYINNYISDSDSDFDSDSRSYTDTDTESNNGYYNNSNVDIEKNNVHEINDIHDIDNISNSHNSHDSYDSYDSHNSYDSDNSYAFNGHFITNNKFNLDEIYNNLINTNLNPVKYDWIDDDSNENNDINDNDKNNALKKLEAKLLMNVLIESTYGYNIENKIYKITLNKIFIFLKSMDMKHFKNNLCYIYYYKPEIKSFCKNKKKILCELYKSHDETLFFELKKNTTIFDTCIETLKDNKKAKLTTADMECRFLKKTFEYDNTFIDIYCIVKKNI